MSGLAHHQPEDPGPPSPSKAPPRAVARRYNVPRSCVRCHERKVRCDKATPCRPCVRAEAECRYPGPERAKRRSQKTTLATVVPRLEVLEHSLVVINQSDSPLTEQAAVGSQRTDSGPPSPPHD